LYAAMPTFHALPHVFACHRATVPVPTLLLPCRCVYARLPHVLTIPPAPHPARARRTCSLHRLAPPRLRWDSAPRSGNTAPRYRVPRGEHRLLPPLRALRAPPQPAAYPPRRGATPVLPVLPPHAPAPAVPPAPPHTRPYCKRCCLSVPAYTLIALPPRGAPAPTTVR